LDVMIKLDFKKNNGLVPAIAQDFKTGEVLMLAWMDRDTLEETLGKGVMVYYSRSRKKRWLKGESSGHIQTVQEAYLDCDGDTILFKVDQTGAACHENYYSCFFRKRTEDTWSVKGYSWIDTTVKPGINYQYAVKSIFDNSNSGWSVEIDGKLLKETGNIWEYLLDDSQLNPVFTVSADTGRLYCFMFEEYAMDPAGTLYGDSPSRKRLRGVCLNAVTGDVIWNQPEINVLDTNEYDYFISKPLLTATGRIIIQSNDDIFCLNGYTGDVIWSTLNTNYMGTPLNLLEPVLFTGRIFMSCINDAAYDYYNNLPSFKVICLNEADGVELWSFDIKNILISLRLSNMGNLIAVTDEGKTYYLDTESGQPFEELPEGDVLRSVAAGNNATLNSYAYYLDTAAMQIVCKYNTAQ